jgi:hypothetical protein
VKPSKFFYDDVTELSIVTPVSVVIYCDEGLILCQNHDAIDVYGGGQTNEMNWYLSLDHSQSRGDGTILLTANNGATLTTPSIESGDKGTDAELTVTRPATTTLPLEVDVNLAAATDQWLIYNQNADEPPAPLYHIRFIGTAGNLWAGYGKTGHYLDTNTSTKKNRRLGW